MTPHDILHGIFQKASAASASAIADTAIRERLDYVCRCMGNRAGVRLLMACLLAKLHQPDVDPRKPYTEIGGVDSFSGRTYDERYLTAFINEHRLPVNQTTAFLTPTLRNINHALTTDIELVGRPRELYKNTLALLEDVARQRINAESLLVETVRTLMLMRDEKLALITALLEAQKQNRGALPLSSEAIITLLSQHLACKNASRLPVLIVAAAYKAGALGDVEICLTGENTAVTVYEMKMKRVSADDIDAAALKIARAPHRIHNYLFVTTDTIDPGVAEYAASFYEKLDGTEIAVLDCVGFLRHFLHLFHRLRANYLDAYQDLLLAEPDSAVSQSLKEVFLALRQAAESGE